MGELRYSTLSVRTKGYISMIRDAFSISSNDVVETDVCVVGAGVAGITLARELIGAKFDVCMLESGALKADKETQALYRGDNVGFPYYPLDTARSRQFGGSSNRWLMEIGNGQMGGRLRPLSELDFEKRDWVPYSGWPFDKANLQPYYERAQNACKSGPYASYDHWEDTPELRRLPLKQGKVETAIYQFVPRDLFVKDARDELGRARNVTVWLNANALELETSENGRSVTQIRAACLDAKVFRVTAKLFVLAQGGIETPRLLLLSNKTCQNGLGNDHDLVGRFFMEHPHLWSGFIIPSNKNIFEKAKLYDLKKLQYARNDAVLGQLTIVEDVIRREKMLNYAVHIKPDIRPRKGIKHMFFKGAGTVGLLIAAVRNRDLNDFNRHLSTLFPVVNDFSISVYRRAVRSFNKVLATTTFEVFRLNHMVEQAPNPNSRVLLSNEKDKFGQNRIQLDWQLTPFDIRSIIRAQEIIDDEFRRAGLGKVEIQMDSDKPPPDLHGGWHHMGTTRMHNNPKEGVVDSNSRVYGVENLYIAGSSVFPTGGYANPVLTITALTIRLADHIKLEMQTP
jgi:choline dehydrogenase-like flavoprotein